MKYKLLLFILVFSTLKLLSQDHDHSFFILGGRNISVENSLYLNLKNPDYEAWSKPYKQFLFGGGYTYGLNRYLGIGLHFDRERLKFDNFSVGADATATRTAFGMHFQAKYPNTKFHLISGSFLNLGKLKSTNFDFNLSGFEYGIYLGPEYSLKYLMLSLLVSPKFSYFYSKGEEFDNVLILSPSFSIKIAYTLNPNN